MQKITFINLTFKTDVKDGDMVDLFLQFLYHPKLFKWTDKTGMHLNTGMLSTIKNTSRVYFHFINTLKNVVHYETKETIYYMTNLHWQYDS